MAANAWVLYSAAKLKVHNSTIDLDADTLKCALFLSTYTPAVTHTTYSSILANEHTNGNGYTTGGVTVAGTVSEASGTITFDVADPQWTANGGSIVCRYAVLYDSTTGDLLSYCLLDNTPANITVTDTNVLTIQMNANGVYQAA